MSGTSYFGYGERTPEVMEAIIGRRPAFERALLPGFQLFIQRLVDMTPEVQAIMAINRTPEELANQQSYAARRTRDENAFLPGLVYLDITDEEFELADNFDIEGLWFSRYRDRFIRIANDDGATFRLGGADVHADPIGELGVPAPPFDGVFPPALTVPSRTIEIATNTRISFSQR